MTKKNEQTPAEAGATGTAELREEITPSEDPVRDQLFVMIPDRRVSEHALRNTIRHIVAHYPVGRVVVDMSSLPGITIADTLIKLGITIDRFDSEPLRKDEIDPNLTSVLSGAGSLDDIVASAERVLPGDAVSISQMPAYVVLFYAPPLPNMAEPHIGATSPLCELHETLREVGRDHLSVYPPEMGLRTNDGKTYVLRSQIVASSADVSDHLEKIAENQERIIAERMASIEADPQVRALTEEISKQAKHRIPSHSREG